jgi:hypothetical protein
VNLNDIPGVTSVRWTHKIPFGRTGVLNGIIGTDGPPETLEAIRDRLAWSGAAIHSLPELEAKAMTANDDYSSVRQGGLALTLFLPLVSAATLLVAMVDWLMERRRSLAVLSAVGVTTSTIRSSILVQVGLSLASSLLFGVAGAIVITSLLYRALNQPIVLSGQIPIFGRGRRRGRPRSDGTVSTMAARGAQAGSAPGSVNVATVSRPSPSSRGRFSSTGTRKRSVERGAQGGGRTTIPNFPTVSHKILSCSASSADPPSIREGR